MSARWSRAAAGCAALALLAGCGAAASSGPRSAPANPADASVAPDGRHSSEQQALDDVLRQLRIAGTGVFDDSATHRLFDPKADQHVQDRQDLYGSYDLRAGAWQADVHYTEPGDRTLYGGMMHVIGSSWYVRNGIDEGAVGPWLELPAGSRSMFEDSALSTGDLPPALGMLEHADVDSVTGPRERTVIFGRVPLSAALWALGAADTLLEGRDRADFAGTVRLQVTLDDQGDLQKVLLDFPRTELVDPDGLSEKMRAAIYGAQYTATFSGIGTTVEGVRRPPNPQAVPPAAGAQVGAERSARTTA